MLSARLLKPALRRLALPAIAVALAGGCGGRHPPGTPERLALDLFELAGSADPDPATATRLFGSRVAAEPPPGLLDAVAAIERLEGPTVGEVYRPVDEPVAYVDVVGRLAGGGVARYNLRLEQLADGAWAITWFQGPGVEWPVRRGGGRLGLSSSSPDPAAVDDDP